jgi:peptidoglycan/xylan/chitin deacetylase (PgdA/CDA1 family)
LTSALLQETLGRWRAIGATLGNHTATHPDLNLTAIDAYLADIARAQALIERTVPAVERWFRPPYLHVGDRADTKQGRLSHS